VPEVVQNSVGGRSVETGAPPRPEQGGLQRSK
jgi:hypothetical protein